MKWYKATGKDSDVAVSSRIRLARNLTGYPFASRLTEAGAKEIIDKVSAALPDYKRLDFDSLSREKAASYAEAHLVSPEFVNASLPHSLLCNEEESVAVMLCEEDHIRLQCIKPGNALSEAFEAAVKADDVLCEKLSIAYDEEMGFLTRCPTNLGTGMRASVMLFLPALTMTGQIDRLAAALSKIGLTMRGLYGEGSNADGCLYQVSNQITLGITEEDTIKKLDEVVAQIIDKERTCRNTLKSDSGDRLRDRILRSYGVMKYAYLLTSQEFMKLFADVRLGISLGYLDGISYEKLGELMIQVLPATLSVNAGRELTEAERDRRRAEIVSAAV